jgi:hypothetical protein
MKTYVYKSILSLTAAFALTFPACSQRVNINFTSEVTQVSPGLLPGVAIGSVITGLIQVDLAHLPPDTAEAPERSSFWYSGLGIPGYVFQFETGLQTFSLDSVNAAADLGIAPAIDLIKAADADVLDFAARDAGNPFGVLLRLADYRAPFTLLDGTYFPEDVNLSAGLADATFTYSDFINPPTVVARITSASMVIEQDTPSALLIYRVNASDLPTQRKRPLIATLEAADALFAADQCEAGLKALQTFQNKVRAQVARLDSVLADHLTAEAQEIIDSGCTD